MSRKQRTVSVLAVMAKYKHRRGSADTRALLRLERTMNLLEGGKGGWGREGGEGTEGGWGGDGGRVGTWGRVGREVGEGRGRGRGGRDNCYTYSNRYVQ